jgi:hypothetical protein
MKMRFLITAFAAAFVCLSASGALASDANGNHDPYTWYVGVPATVVPEFPTTAMAAGQRGTITMQGTGRLKAGPDNYATGGGTYSLVDTQGHPVGSAGTWAVEPGQRGLIMFETWGCGNLGPMPVPAGFCGGQAKLRIVLVGGPLTGEDGVLTIYCLIGQPPGGKEEGIALVLGSGTNFPQTEEGATLFTKP